jgi:hypothetical protein
MSSLEFVLMIALNFSHTHQFCMYDQCPRGVLRYNCMDFSKDLTLELRANNVTAYPMCGWILSRNHFWVGVELNGELTQIEPQTGEIVYPMPEYSWYIRGRRCIARGLN